MSAMFWNMIYTQQPDNRELLQHIANDDLPALLRSDRLRAELAQPTPQVISYLAAPATLQALIQLLNAPEQALSAAANDVIVADIPQLMDQISTSESLLNALFDILLPYDSDNMQFYALQQLPSLPPAARRVSLASAENFCRAVYTLISKPQRKLRILNFLLANLQIMSYFTQAIQSAPITETLHYIFKIDSAEQQLIQQNILISSNFIQQLFQLFLQENAAFEELVHVSFICQSFLQSEINFEVRREIMENCIEILQKIDSKFNSQNVKNLFAIVAITVKYAVRGGILAEIPDESAVFAQFVDRIVSCAILVIDRFLDAQMTPSESKQENLFIIHSCSVISELFRIQESVFEAIKDKETLLLNRQFKPEQAILYMTEYYSTTDITSKKNSTDITSIFPLPFVIGFSFIFQDIYQHLTDSTGFKFDQNFVSQISDKGPVKKINSAHLFGPNGEICAGSVELIISKIIASGIIKKMVFQAVSNPENSIIHVSILSVLSILVDYVKFSVPFAVEFLDSDVLTQLVSGVLRDGPEASKLRVSQQVARTSLDALCVAFLKKIGAARANGDISRVLARSDVRAMAELFEVKSALGM
ncbi:hypothetical protein SS50377_21473 [Spironucleus salmonicida]|uniref:Uncharacterized protein n=1 Tax=Spironucleus salmonicida TaxID=348837 RepID=V6LS24_9EUKA|nr:hypothetical protein SS50377_21473 [Spironucleus salmonicida]|eukprot:EST47375.1 hypothetical protein SS50377_12548 [Spironucleus salmonicida]